MTKHSIQLVGKNEDESWPHFAWNVVINGEHFSYKTGLGILNKSPTGRTLETPKKPTLDDVLNCLFLDADSGNESFDFFCDTLGYSNDSLKAFDIYRSCAENAKKLHKALGKDFAIEQERVRALEL